MFAVNQWGSHPDAGNDDCWTGEDFDTLEAAEQAYERLVPRDPSVAFIELNGPGVQRVRENPRFDARGAARDDREWQRERAMQVGMGLGIDAYNDEMGW